MKEFHWLTEIDASERHALLEGVADELRDIAITQSKNVELNIEGYNRTLPSPPGGGRSEGSDSHGV